MSPMGAIAGGALAGAKTLAKDLSAHIGYGIATAGTFRAPAGRSLAPGTNRPSHGT
jgi:hypothetical protein